MIRVSTAHRVGLLAILVANGIGQAAAAIAAAVVVESAFSQLGQPQTIGSVAQVAASLLGVATIAAALRGRERIDAERLGQSYCHDLRMHLVDRLTAMSPRSLHLRSTGATALRFVGDLTAIRNWVSLGLARLAVAGTMITGTLAALALIDRRLSVAVGAACVLGGVGAIAQGPALRRASHEARRRRARLAGRVTEAINAVGAIHANNAVDRERRRIRRGSERLRNAMIDRAKRLGRLQAIAEATTSAATASLLVVALATGLGGPQVAAAMTVVGLLVPQLRGLARVQEYRQHRNVAVDAIGRFVDRPTMLTPPTDPRPLPDGPGELALRNVSIGPVADVSATLHAGQTVALVGPNGAGKTTLLAAIARLVDVDGGSIELDGVDLAHVTFSDAHTAVGISAPDLPLMRGSLRRNLTYRRRDASDTEIDHVIDLCDLRPLIAALPAGVDHRISESGSNLSSGQRQRLMLARAILGRPRLLLLDEADANLDATSASVVDRVIEAHHGSCIIVTHRAERAAAADLIWHVDNGQLIEHGPSCDLLRPGTRTAALFGFDESTDGCAA
ncbi:MAG: ABC transporter ATP-binding protein [Ilumatobacter sp.]|uniref:ATP-binding cassette domain-containing protein n=1 Tax=Ilumatobacter sp. TaxID=1967498 RepID=UPI00260DE567|nr:ABC transporter ATP-binding protein [Ilumatobacter sp.]MDJ0768964.1 ABC transporter ATP-binding protein [Ilumatobacter sp.]